MSVAGIASSCLSALSSFQRNYQQVKGEFKQLGQDLQTGNLAQAQTDFITLSQSMASQLGANSPVAQTLGTVGQSQQSANSPVGQPSFPPPTAVPSPNAVTRSPTPYQGGIGGVQSTFTQMLNQLGQALQSGNLSAAQQAFSAAQQVWQQTLPNTMSGTGAYPQTAGGASSGMSIMV
jgi:hypothetical protein